jgi:hypothetical protein
LWHGMCLLLSDDGVTKLSGHGGYRSSLSYLSYLTRLVAVCGWCNLFS